MPKKCLISDYMNVLTQPTANIECCFPKDGTLISGKQRTRQEPERERLQNDSNGDSHH